MKYPIILENSKILFWLSKITGIKIDIISFCIFIICKEKLGKRVKRHKMIRYRQQKELFFIGYLFLYIYFFMKGFIKYKNFKDSYAKNPLELEAYHFETDSRYLIKRKKYNWKMFL